MMTEPPHPLERIVEAALAKSDRTHKLRDNTMFVFTLLGILLAIGVPVYLHQLAHPGLKSWLPNTNNLLRLSVPLNSPDGPVIIDFYSDHRVEWRKPNQ